jgi:hypothetical protein
MPLNKWTVVQHSGYAYGGKPGFEQGLETYQLMTAAELRRVQAAAGLLFDSWTAADTYGDNAVGRGLYPAAPGTFSDKTVNGQRIYLPAPAGTALDEIALLMNGEEWTGDVMAEVAAVIRGTGRPLSDVSNG